jgi:hypothetical protein
MHVLYAQVVLLVTVIWIISLYWWFKRDLQLLLRIKQRKVPRMSLFSAIVLALIAVQLLISLLGALAPERAFDALWYHLTIPKIFIMNHALTYITGGLYYYSLMPKLVDLLYIPPLMLGSQTGAHLIHFTFAILTLIALYKLSRVFLPATLSLLVVLIFSSNIVVGWEATTAYIDLGRTFFELMSFYGIILFLKEKKELWLIESAIMLGLAASTKVLALSSLMIIIPILLYIIDDRINALKKIGIYILIAIAVPLPYFVFSYLFVGSPIYPFFTTLYSIDTGAHGVTSLLDIWKVFVNGDDPVSPLYLIVLPLIPFILPRLKKLERIVITYFTLGLLVWLIIPRTGGGRFILPYLPVFSLAVGIVLQQVKNKIIYKCIEVTSLILAIICIGYRGMASIKYIPVVLGEQTEHDFLIKNLNFNYGDFYDTDGYFSSHIKKTDKVLIYGGHNLFYVDFPFIHETFVKPGDEFNYLLLPDTMDLPDRFSIWKLIYTNPITHMSLYTLGGQMWVY